MVYIETRMAPVERVGVRELRQNASRVVRQVEQHGPVVVTVNGRDAVVMTQLDGGHRWVTAAQALHYWETLEADPQWAEELERQRAADLVTDPWAQR